MTVHNPNEPLSGGSAASASSATTGTPGVDTTRSAAPQEHLITPGTAPKGAQPPGDDSHGTAQAAKDEAANVAGSAKDAGRHVAGAAKDEARNVAGEAKHQARQLLDQTMGEAREQAKAQQGRAAGGIRTFGDDLQRMADNADDGMASQVVGEVARRASSAAGWLDDREPADLFDELKSFARRRPWTFIAIAGAAGLVVGRLARGIASEAKDERDSRSGSGSSGSAYGATGSYDATGYGATGGYDTTGTYGTTSAYGTTASADTTGAAWTTPGTDAGTAAAPGAEPADNEPWLGERPVSDVPVDPDLPLSGDPAEDGYSGSRREAGL